MNGYVSKLYDIDCAIIPEELLNARVEAEQLDGMLEALSLRYAKSSEVPVAQKGDILYCDSKSYSDKRDVIVYTGVALFGAEKAAEDGVGKAVGEEFSTMLFDSEVTLKVKRIIHRDPAVINDEFIASLNIPGAATVAEYRKQLENEALKNKKTESKKMIGGFLLKELANGCEFVYDENELKEYAEEYLSEMLKMYPEELAGEDPEQLKESIALQQKETWAIKAFCEKKGIKPDFEEAKAEVSRILEMAALTGEDIPSEDELLDSEISRMYFTEFFEYAEAFAEKRMDEFNGNN